MGPEGLGVWATVKKSTFFQRRSVHFVHDQLKSQNFFLIWKKLLRLLGRLDARVQAAPEVHKRKDQQANTHAGSTRVVGLGLRDEAWVLIVSERVDADRRDALDIRQAVALVVDRELEHSILVRQLQGRGKSADSAVIIQRNLVKRLADVGVQHNQLELHVVG